MNNYVTAKGSNLPLMSLKGKPYMLVAHRLVWFNEEVTNFEIESQFVELTDTHAICRSTVKIKDDKGNVVKSATATKKETKSDFPDFVEKSESSSMGRALAMLGFGTQFAIADLDEGDRLADSPVAPASSVKRSGFTKPAATPAAASSAPKKADDSWV